MVRGSVWVLAAAAVAACGGGGGEQACDTARDCDGRMMCVDGRCRPGPDAGGADAAADAGELDGGDLDAGARDASSCTDACDDGECIDGECCMPDSVCGDVCCAGGEVCSFSRCVTPGGDCRSEDDCAESEYCEPQLGDGDTGQCLPRPPPCEEGVEPDPEAPMCVASCTFELEADAFEVTESYAWGEYDGDPAEPNLDDVRNAPIVIQLDDDDGDGRISRRDTAEIVVIVSPADSTRPDGTNPIGDLVVLSAEGGSLEEKWRVEGEVHPWTYLAAGNFDGEPGNEIVACSVQRDDAIAYGVGDTGLEELWRSDPLPRACTMPSLADFDQDGTAEVLVGGTVLDGPTGDVRFPLERADTAAIASDVDGDGRLDVVSGRRVQELEDGSFRVVAELGTAATHPLVADLDPGGLPEIVSVETATHTLHVWRLDGSGGIETLRSDLDINGPLDPARCPESSTGRTQGGGPPTAADVNGDGVPDIAVAGGVGYAVLDGAALVDPAVDDADAFFWANETIDCSSARTGSSVFDFNGDGRAEVLYGDEHTFRIYDGMTGDVLFDTCNTNGTILELPVVADVDSDGQADVVVAANARYRACLDDPTQRVSGVRVYSSPSNNWVRTRRVWNQHAYHVTNVEEDGTIPAIEPPNYATGGLNNFRQNAQPDGELSAADAIVELRPDCGDGGVIATVRNLGEAALPPGVTVRLVHGTIDSPGTELGTAATTRTLFPLQAEDLRFDVSDPEVLGGQAEVHAVLEVPEDVQECRTDNNTTEGLRRTCLI